MRVQAHVLPVHAPQEEVGTRLVQVAVLGIQPDKPERPDARADELCRVVSVGHPTTPIEVADREVE